MINAVYRLIAPRMIDIAYREISPRGKTLLTPAYLSICRADQRYYLGQRPQETLREKLPMALLHECVGQVVYDDSGLFQIGEAVVPIPNLPMATDAVIAENYLASSAFASSGMDGFLQEYISVLPDRLVRVPPALDLRIAAFLELISVAMHAIRRFDSLSHGRRTRVGIWGDGNLGFLTALLLKTMFPQTQICVIGAVQTKLSYFSFADETQLTQLLPEDFQVDHAFECVGGSAAQAALAQMIPCLAPEGTLMLMGVSESPVSLPTRQVLEKGLRLFGSSRSGKQDFEDTVALLQSHPEILPYLENLVGECASVRSIADIHAAFEADLSRGFGKTILEWMK